MPERNENEEVAPSADEEVTMDPFKVWCSQQGIKDELVATLYDEGFDKLNTLALMQEEDVAALNIPQKGQLRLLQAAIAKAKSQQNPTEQSLLVGRADNQTLLPPRPVNNLPTGLSIDALFNQLPVTANEQLNSDSNTFTRPEFDPSYHLIAGKATTGNDKALEIVDFVGLSAKVDFESEEIVSEIGEGSKLVLKTGGKKLKFDAISVWQWALGAIRIEDELVRVGKLPSKESKRQYLGYCCKILELNSRYEWVSILHYDKEYRGQQARFNFPWGTEVPHLSSVQLKDKKLNFSNFSNSKKGRQNTQSQQKNLICRDFNRDKCTYVSCKFAHKCSVEGCDQKHPASKHVDSKN